MAYRPVSGTVPQYHASGSPASGYCLKGYVPGTDTAKSMAIDAAGSSTLAKCLLSAQGYPLNGSSAVFIPHFDGPYKLALYTNATDADANTTANATWVVDSLPVELAANSTTYDLTTEFGTSSHTNAITGHIVRTNAYDSNRQEGSGIILRYTGTDNPAKSGNVPDADGYFYDALGQQFKYAKGGPIYAMAFGARAGATSAANGTALVAALTFCEDVYSGYTDLNGSGQVFLMAGTYAVDRTLTVGFGVDFYGDGAYATQLVFDSISGTDSACVKVGPEGKPGSGTAGYTFGSQLRKMTIKGGGAESYTVWVVGMHQHSEIAELQIRNVENTGLQVDGAGGPAFSTIESVHITPANTAIGTAEGALCSAIEGIGETSIALQAAGTGSIIANDIIMFSNDLATEYTVSSGDADVSDGGNLTITPGLVVATAVGTSIRLISRRGIVLNQGSTCYLKRISIEGEYSRNWSVGVDSIARGSITFNQAHFGDCYIGIRLSEQPAGAYSDSSVNTIINAKDDASQAVRDLVYVDPLYRGSFVMIGCASYAVPIGTPGSKLLNNQIDGYSIPSDKSVGYYQFPQHAVGLPNVSGSGATVTLLASQSGQTVLMDRAAGIVFTLPAPASGSGAIAGIGMKFRFLVTVSVSSNAYSIATSSGTIFLAGSIQQIIDASAVSEGQVADGSTTTTLAMNGGTTGGLIGTVIEVECVSATVWMVSGTLVGVAALATPFS